MTAAEEVRHVVDSGNRAGVALIQARRAERECRVELEEMEDCLADAEIELIRADEALVLAESQEQTRMD